MNRTMESASSALVLALALAAPGAAAETARARTAPATARRRATPRPAPRSSTPTATAPTTRAPMGVNGDTIKIGTIRPAVGPLRHLRPGHHRASRPTSSPSTPRAGSRPGTARPTSSSWSRRTTPTTRPRPRRWPRSSSSRTRSSPSSACIGTENNMAIRQYLNDDCVPNIALATGSPEWGKAERVPLVHLGAAVLRHRGPRLGRVPEEDQARRQDRPALPGRRLRQGLPGGHQEGHRGHRHHHRGRAELQPALRRHHARRR